MLLPQVVFWKWITSKMLGLVTQSAVYHWSIEGTDDIILASDLVLLGFFLGGFV